MHIPERFRIHETKHWLINHRIDSHLPGYLMFGSKDGRVADLSALDDAALAAFGPLLARTQRVLRATLAPQRIHITRYGHAPGYPVHFHLIPIYGWVAARFQQAVRNSASGQCTSAQSEGRTDGPALSLFVSRVFCDAAEPPPIEGPSVDDAVALLRSAMRDQSVESDGRG